MNQEYLRMDYRWAAFVIALTSASVIGAEVAGLDEESEGAAVEWEEARYEDGYSPRAGVQYHAPSGLGYRNALMSFEAFVPIWQNGTNLTFTDLRLLMHDQQLGANLGGGHRFYSSLLDKSIGAFAFFDNQNTGNRTFSQISAGLDLLGSDWEVRANVYLPLDRDAQVVETPLTETVFSGRQLFSNRLLVSETALTGVDVEIGALVWEMYNLWGFVGGYHLEGDEVDSTWGASARLELRISDKAAVVAALQRDDVFGTNAVMSVALWLPGSRPRGADNLDLAPDRLAHPIYRQQNIIVTRTTRVDRVLPNDPATNRPFRIVHVAPNAAPAEADGSFEQPFGTIGEALAAATAESIIYVQPNDAGYPEPVVLSDGQRLLGSSRTHIVATTSGPTTIPQLTQNRAVLTSDAEYAVILANNTVVSGLEIRNSQGTGVFGEGVRNVQILDSDIDASVRGIELRNVGGEVAVSNVTIGQTAREGILVQNMGVPVQLALTGNRLTGNNWWLPGQGALAVELTNVSDPSSVWILQNDISNATNHGVAVDLSGAANARVLVNNNDIRNSTGDGAALNVVSSPGAQLQVGGNTLTANENGISTRIAGSSTDAALSIVQNGITKSRESGAEVTLDGSTTFNVNIQENEVSESTGPGLTLTTLGSASGATAVTDNNLTGNKIGISASASTGDVNWELTVQGNTVSGNEKGGFFLGADLESRIALDVRENRFNNNGSGAGIRLLISDDAQIVANIEQNFLNNNQRGVNVRDLSSEFQVTDVSILSNTISGNDKEGLRIVSEGDARVAALISANQLSENLHGVRVQTDDRSQMDVDLQANLIEDSQSTGVLLSSLGTNEVSQLRVLARNLSITNSGAPGFVAESDNKGRLLLGLHSNSSDRGYEIRNSGSDSQLQLAVGSDDLANEGLIVTEGPIIHRMLEELFP